MAKRKGPFTPEMLAAVGEMEGACSDHDQATAGMKAIGLDVEEREANNIVKKAMCERFRAVVDHYEQQ